MRKNYFLSFLMTLLISSFSFGQSAVITGYMDSPCPSQAGRTLEIYVDGTIDFTGWSVVRQSNGGGFDPGSATIDISSLGSVTDAFVYLTNDSATLDSEFGVTMNVLENSNINGNGDDGWQLEDASDAIIDRFGVDGEDASGTAWDHLDSYAYRMDGATPNGGSFDPANWTFGATNLLDGQGACNSGSALSTLVPFGSYSATASTDPSIAINSPSNGQVFDASVTEVAVTLNIQNFVLSGDDGSGNSDGTGQGYILATLQQTGQADEVSNQFSDMPGNISLTPGRSYTLIAELVDNSGNSLSPAVSAMSSFSVELPCDLDLGSITTICDATTSGSDTFTGMIEFTGGNTGVNYTIDAGGATVAGDDPDTVAAGTIMVTGLPEGADVTVTITGDATSSCDFTRTLFSPTCIPFPVIETFDYTAGGALTGEAAWTSINSGDDILVASGNLNYTGLEASAGNSITFDSNGAEAYTSFSNVSSGSVYASFLFSVTAFQTNGSPDLTDGGYFAGLASGTTGYDARLWVRPNPDTSGSTFDIGFGHESSNPTFTAGTYNLNDVIFVVMSYDVDNGQTNVWIDPDASSFGNTPPAVTINTTDDFPPSVINTFIFRQDSDRETPFIQVDELRIDTSWASVTPAASTASVGENQIDGFAAYPNPVRGNQLTVTTNSLDTKTVDIYNVLGKKVFTRTFSGAQDTFNVSNVSSGIYILKVTEGNRISTQKLIIE